ncbi:LysM peptidoglycan-binding domain-containing protein [Desulfolithobacter sp.]
MKTHLFISCCLLIAVLAAVSACTPMAHLAGDPAGQDAFDTPPDTAAQYEVAEPQQLLEEELSALNQLGSWEEPGKEIPPEEAQVTFDFPITINKQVEFYLDLFQNRQRRYFKRWLARSTKYLPFIQEELKKAGLPLDLAYLAMIESGFNPRAYSRAHASGLWQFIRSTGRNYGLRIDRWVDERRNPDKATRAAIAYLSTLYNEFGDWYLAVAAYNAGEGKIGRAIRRYKTRDFWQLARYRYLRLETKRYVPKLIAAILIAREPEKYGFTDIKYEEPERYDLVKVPPRTDLAAVATAGNTSVKTLKNLNTELLRNQTPPGLSSYTLRIPEGRGEVVAANLKRLHPVITTGFKTHKVRKGDTLTRICRKYGLNKTTLLKANDLHSATLRPGQRLRIPYRTTKYVLLKEGETPESRFAAAGRDGELVLHKIQRGDTLGKISRLYNVPVNIIMQWNDITDVHRIRAGDHLALYLDRGVSYGTAVTASAGSTASPASDYPVLAETKKRKPATLSRDKAVITYYRVRSGDSLWTIARRFQVSARDIKRWNNLRTSMIHPGKRLVIKKG